MIWAPLRGEANEFFLSYPLQFAHIALKQGHLNALQQVISNQQALGFQFLLVAQILEPLLAFERLTPQVSRRGQMHLPQGLEPWRHCLDSKEWEVVIYLEQLFALAFLSPFPTLETHKRIETLIRWPVK